MPMLEILAMLFFIAFFGSMIFVFIVVPIRRKKAVNNYSQELESMGFNISKRIVTTDFISGHWMDTYVGIWVDYDSMRLAIRTSRKEMTPQIYDFKAINSFQVADGAGGWATSGGYSGVGVGVGFLGIGGGSINMESHEIARNLAVRIIVGGGVAGINTLQLTLWKNNALFGQAKANMKVYQRILECRRAMCDELNNILQINGVGSVEFNA